MRAGAQPLAVLQGLRRCAHPGEAGVHAQPLSSIGCAKNITTKVMQMKKQREPQWPQRAAVPTQDLSGHTSLPGLLQCCPHDLLQFKTDVMPTMCSVRVGKRVSRTGPASAPVKYRHPPSSKCPARCALLPKYYSGHRLSLRVRARIKSWANSMKSLHRTGRAGTNTTPRARCPAPRSTSHQARNAAVSALNVQTVQNAAMANARPNISNNNSRPELVGQAHTGAFGQA